VGGRLVLGSVIVAGGCATGGTGGDGNDNDNGSSGDLTGRIVSPTSNYGVSVLDEAPVSVIYTVTGGSPESIEGYVVEVADSSPDSPAIRTGSSWLPIWSQAATSPIPSFRRLPSPATTA